MSKIDIPLLYAKLCDAVYRGAHPEIDDDFLHTSDVSRRTANRIMDILEEYEFVNEKDYE